MIGGALLCALLFASAPPDVVFLGRAEARASSRSNAVDVLAPAMDLSAEPGLQLTYNTRRLQSQILLAPSLSARITTDDVSPVQPLFSQRIDGTLSTGQEDRSLLVSVAGSAAAGVQDVNTAEERLGQPFGLNLGAGAVPLADANVQMTMSTRPWRDLRLAGYAGAAFLAAPSVDALDGGVALGDDLIQSFATLVPQLRPFAGTEVTTYIGQRLNAGARLMVDAALDNESFLYAGTQAVGQVTWLPTRNTLTQLQMGGMVAAVEPLPSLSVWPIVRADASVVFGAPETLLPGGGSLGGGRSGLSLSAGLEPEFDPFLFQVNWQARLDLTATYAPSARWELGLGAGAYARLLATLPPKEGASLLVSPIGVPDDNGANQIGVLTGRVNYAINRQLAVETGILGTARLSADGQTAPQVSVYIAFTGRARDDDAVDLAGDIWRSFY